MYFIKIDGTNHGNPVSNRFENCVALPDELISSYIDTKGFCNLTVENGVVTALEINQEAYDAYIAEHPDVEPEKPVTVESLQQENSQLKERQSFLEDCIAEMASQVYA